MPNPPYSGGVIILKENQDGINARVYHFDEVAAGTPIPKGVAGLENMMVAAGVDFHAERMTATRSALKTAFGQYIDAKFPDTPA